MVTLPTPYPELNQVLRDLVRGLQVVLGDKFRGAYLQGSFAVGEFDAHSDVDFVVAIASELSVAEVAMLQVVHGRIYSLATPWAQHLEGSYFPQSVLCQPAQPQQKLWYLDNGASALILSAHCNSWVVRWVLREKGIALAGPPPHTLLSPIPPDALRQEMVQVIQEWGAEILAQPERFNNHFYQTFIVLSYCRMWHDVYNGYPGSKRAGAAWAKRQLDSVWGGLIDRAWNGRPRPEFAVRRPADPADFAATLQLVEAIMAQTYGAEWREGRELA